MYTVIVNYRKAHFANLKHLHVIESYHAILYPLEDGNLSTILENNHFELLNKFHVRFDVQSGHYVITFFTIKDGFLSLIRWKADRKTFSENYLLNVFCMQTRPLCIQNTFYDINHPQARMYTKVCKSGRYQGWTCPA